MSYEGCSDEIHIAYSERMSPSCPFSKNLEQFLSQLVHRSFSFSLLCSKAWFT